MKCSLCQQSPFLVAALTRIDEGEHCRMIYEALADVDAGCVIDHQTALLRVSNLSIDIRSCRKTARVGGLLHPPLYTGTCSRCFL